MKKRLQHAANFIKKNGEGESNFATPPSVPQLLKWPFMKQTSATLTYRHGGKPDDGSAAPERRGAQKKGSAGVPTEPWQSGRVPALNQ